MSFCAVIYIFSKYFNSIAIVHKYVKKIYFPNLWGRHKTLFDNFKNWADKFEQRKKNVFVCLVLGFFCFISTQFMKVNISK